MDLSEGATRRTAAGGVGLDGNSSGTRWDGRCWVDFEIGDRSEATFDRLYSRLPAAELYRTDAYGVYGLLPADRHVVGKGGAVNWNETKGFIPGVVGS